MVMWQLALVLMVNLKSFGQFQILRLRESRSPKFKIQNSQLEVTYYFDNKDKMLSQVFYLLRSRSDGKYLCANPNPDAAVSYLLMFREDYDALSYLNAHAAEVADRFGVESISGSSVKTLLERWGFNGVGVVQDPLLPNIEFLTTR